MSETGIRRRPGGRSARVRAAVIDATIAALDEHGLDGLAVNEVAARAGVSETSIYRRWGTRDNLMIDALLSAAGEHLAVPDTGSLREDLLTYVTELADYLATPLGSALDRVLASAGDSPEAARARTEFWAARTRLSGEIVARAVRRGELPDTTDPGFVLELVVAPLHFKVVFTHEPVDPGLAARVVDTILSGIVPRVCYP